MVSCCFHRNHKACCLWNARQASARTEGEPVSSSACLPSTGRGHSTQHGCLSRASFPVLDFDFRLFPIVVGGNLSSWRLWVWCLAPKPSQDLLHSPWRRRPWHGTHRSVSSGLLGSAWLWTLSMKEQPQTCYYSHWGLQVARLPAYVMCP